MMSYRQLNPAKREIFPSATPQRFDFNSLSSRMKSQLINRYQSRSRSFPDRNRIPVVIRMSVTHENKITLNLIRLGRSFGIPRQKRVDQDLGLWGGNQKTGVTQVLNINL
jgi:hypothetical protein